MKRLAGAWMAVVVVVAVTAAYLPSMRGEFVFDDLCWITQNNHLVHGDGFWAYAGDEGFRSRPVLAASLYANYLVGGLNPLGYHVVNVACHVGAVLMLGLLAGWLALRHFEKWARPFGWSCALIWGLHPLCTAAASYTVQRSETMAAGLLFLALYAVARSSESWCPRRWQGLAIVAFLLSLGAKETTAVLPILAVLMDWAYFYRLPWKTWLRERGWLYGLCGGLLLLASPHVAWLWTGESSPVPRGTYLASEWEAWALYLQLAVWPFGLCFDRGWMPTNVPNWPAAAIVSCVVVFALARYARHPVSGFPLLAGLITLLPTSLVPMFDLTFDYRAYLLVAGIVALVLAAVFYLCMVNDARKTATMLVLCLAAFLGVLSFERNADYRTGYTLALDTALKAPKNPRALLNLGAEQMKRKEYLFAAQMFSLVMELSPNTGRAWHNRSCCFLELGYRIPALVDAAMAQHLEADNPACWNELGNALASLGNLDEAERAYQSALKVDGRYGPAQANLAAVYWATGRKEAAQEARRLAEASGVEISPPLREAMGG